MKKIALPIVLSLFLLVAMFGLIQIAKSQGLIASNGDVVIDSQRQGENLREITAPNGVEAPSAPDISFIDSPTAGCIQPDPAKDECYINWYYMSVSADPNYMIAMTVTLNTIGHVARYSGFFQTSMYVPYNMQGDGFKVACGPLGAGGHPQLGNAYAYTIRARDSANLKSANYGTSYCPAYIP